MNILKDFDGNTDWTAVAIFGGSIVLIVLVGVLTFLHMVVYDDDPSYYCKYTAQTKLSYQQLEVCRDRND